MTQDESELELLEAVLAGHPSVADCAVLERRNASGTIERIAYVVPLLPYTEDELRSHVRRGLPESAALPDAFVPISAVPLSPSGDPDEEALSRLPVVDSGLLERMRRRLDAVCGPDGAAVVVAERRLETPLLHLSDVLPGYDRRRSTRACSSVLSDPHPAERRSSTAHPKGSRPAVADGGPLDFSPLAPSSLPGVLTRAASEHGDEGIVFVDTVRGDTRLSYRGLLERAERLLSGLRKSGVRAGDRLLLQLESRSDFIETFWAAILGGLIPVPLDVPATYRQRSKRRALENAWRVVGEPVVVTSGERLREIESAAREQGLDGFRVLDLEALRGMPDREHHRPQPDELTLLMLTSGSTGVPKAVRLTHRNLLSRTEGSRQLNGFGSGDVSLNWMPLDHVAGLIYFHLRDVYLGCRQIQLPIETVLHEPLSWLDALEKFEVTITFAPNFAFGLVNDREKEIERRRWKLGSLRFVLNGAEAIVPRTARKFLRLLAPHGLPAGAMHPAWGMSETSSGVTYSETFSLETTRDDDAFAEVGRPVPGFSLRIVDDEDRIVEEGTLGRLQVKGLVVTDGYFGAPEVTRESFSPDGWFKTGDLGFIRDGRLTITGREKDVVIINSVKYYCHSIEAAVEELEGVQTSFTAVSAVRDPDGGDTDGLAVFFNPVSFQRELLVDLVQRVAAAVRERAGIAADYVVPLEREAFPKTSVGKIQRSLLGKQLESGELDDRLKRVDLLTASSNTLPAWFYRRVWRAKRGKTSQTPVDGERRVAIFLDAGGVGSRLREELTSRGIDSILIEPGARFERRSSRGFQIDPRIPEHYVRLLELLRDEAIEATDYVHLLGLREHEDGVAGTAEIEAAQTCGSLSVLGLARALGRLYRDEPDRVRVLVVTNGTASVEARDRVAFERAPVIGLIKAIPQEMPWIDATHLDVEPREPRSLSQAILDELSFAPLDREVAYRAGERFVAGLQRASLRREVEGGGAAFEPSGFYLLSGGLGGIGREIATHLVETAGARLVLVGRRERGPEVEELLATVETEGGEVFYEAGDVRDFEKLSRIVERYEQKFGRRLDGVVHLAGGYRECLLVDEGEAGLQEMLGPRTTGTANLYRILAARGRGVLILSSSVAGFFGGAGMGAYAAAHAALSAFAEARSAEGVRVRSFLWSNWEDVGQARSRRAKDLPLSHGYAPMTVERALRSLEIGLRQDEPSLLVGLDAGNRHVRRFLPSEAASLSAAQVCCTPANIAAVEACFQESAAADRFGIPIQAEITAFELLPRNDAGEVDAQQVLLLLDRKRRGRAPQSAPRTGVEHRLASIWKSVLGVADVSLEDSFFELGGDSLLATRTLGRIRDAFGVEFSLRTLFEATSLEELARRVEEATATETAAGAEPIDADELLARLDELDEVEVDALLSRMTDDDEALT